MTTSILTTFPYDINNVDISLKNSEIKTIIKTTLYVVN